ncbi:MAG: nitronate monooxygenase [Oscillospiraceae bacterium]
MKTKLTEMFGIEYPIVQSGMQWLAVPQLAAAVCNAGRYRHHQRHLLADARRVCRRARRDEQPDQQALHRQHLPRPDPASGQRGDPQDHPSVR